MSGTEFGNSGGAEANKAKRIPAEANPSEIRRMIAKVMKSQLEVIAARAPKIPTLNAFHISERHSRR